MGVNDVASAFNVVLREPDTRDCDLWMAIGGIPAFEVEATAGATTEVFVTDLESGKQSPSTSSLNFLQNDFKSSSLVRRTVISFWAGFLSPFEQ